VLELLEQRVQLSTVSPTSVSLGAGSPLDLTKTQTVPVSITLPPLSSTEVDITLLLDDTGSFTTFVQPVENMFSNLVTSLQAALPGVSFGFGVARFEDYGGPGTFFSSDISQSRPFLLDQPIVTAATAAAHGTSLNSLITTALGEQGQGNGGDIPEPDFEALYQLATGAGFDGNGSGSKLESGPAGSVEAATSPGVSGDIPPFSSNVGLTSGSLGGIGWRPGAQHIVLLATDTAPVATFAGSTIPASITGIDGVTVPATAVESTSGRVGFVSTAVGGPGQGPQPAVVPLGGATVQATVNALNSLGIQVITVGPGAAPTTSTLPSTAPSPFFSAIGRLTGAIDEQTGQPLVFDSNSVTNAELTQAFVGSIRTVPPPPAVNISLNASDLPAGMTFTPDPNNVANVGPGGTATFDVMLTVNSVPFLGSFDADFVNSSNGSTLGTVPFAINLPTVSPTPNPPPRSPGQVVSPPPTIVAARRVGINPHPTTFVLTFSTAMNAASVENVNNYDLRAPNGRLDPIMLATYDPSTKSVTLRTKLKVPFNRYFTLEINAQGSTGVKSAAGVALDGMKTGQPGDDYFASVYHFSLTPSHPQPSVKKLLIGRHEASRRSQGRS